MDTFFKVNKKRSEKGLFKKGVDQNVRGINKVGGPILTKTLRPKKP